MKFCESFISKSGNWIGSQIFYSFFDGPKFHAKGSDPASATLKLMPGNGGSIKRKSLHEEIRISIFVFVTFLFNFWRVNKKNMEGIKKFTFSQKWVMSSQPDLYHSLYLLHDNKTAISVFQNHGRFLRKSDFYFFALIFMLKKQKFEKK